jgi:mono/diheme cytochrome c family protein
MRNGFRVLVLIAALGLAAFWIISAPRPLTIGDLPESYSPDIKNGEAMYHIGGCHSCHQAPKDFSAAAVDLPVGGRALTTPIGVLYPPNLTPDMETGIGKMSDLAFVDAMQNGVGRDGSHLIPAFPYTSYAKMKTEAVLDIRAYLMSLPPVVNATPPHNVIALPLVRRGLGLWKIIGFTTKKISDDPAQDVSWNRGRYLVDGPGHCTECHTPRTALMTSDMTNYLGGGPHPDGQGKVPSLRDLVGRGKYKDAADLASALEFGEVMGYEHISSGGMAAVQTNISKLPQADIKAIANYLATLK